MNKLLPLVLSLIVGLTTLAQSNGASALEMEKKVAELAKTVGDPAVVTSTFYRIIALEGDNSTYKDSLAYIYFSARQFAPGFMMADEVLKRDPSHKEMLEIKAISLESLGALDKSAETYAVLFEKTKINYYGYNLAKLQLSMKKYDEAYKTIKDVEVLNDTGTYKVNFSINQNHNQQVELLAAIPYLKGIIEEKLDLMAEAKLSYEKALKIQPDFVLAQDGLDALNL